MSLIIIYSYFSCGALSVNHLSQQVGFPAHGSTVLLVAGTLLQGGKGDQLRQPKLPPSFGSERRDDVDAIDKFYGNK